MERHLRNEAGVDLGSRFQNCSPRVEDGGEEMSSLSLISMELMGRTIVLGERDAGKAAVRDQTPELSGSKSKERKRTEKRYLMYSQVMNTSLRLLKTWTLIVLTQQMKKVVALIQTMN